MIAVRACAKVDMVLGTARSSSRSILQPEDCLRRLRYRLSTSPRELKHRYPRRLERFERNRRSVRALQSGIGSVKRERAK